MRRHQRAVLGAAAVVFAVLLAVFAVALRSSQANARRDVRVRFVERARLSATLTQSLFSSMSDTGRATMTRQYGAAHVTRAAMSKAARRSRLVNLVLLAGDGSRLVSARGTPPDLGRVIEASPPFVRGVLAGRPFALSNVLLRGAKADVIEYAQPILTRHGRRVLVSGFETRLLSKFFANLLARVPLPEGGRAYLLDGNGVIVASPAPHMPPGRLVDERGLVAALRARRSGSLAGGRYFAASAVEGSPWSVVLTAPRTKLYASLGGTGEWLPWIALAGFGLLAAVALLLVGRISRGAADLRQAETRFRGVFDASPIGIVLLDEDLRFHHVNDAFCRVTGLSANELHAKTLDGLIHPDSRERVQELLAEVLCGDIPSFRVETRYISKAEDIFWAATTITVLRDEKGRAPQILGLVEDVTERRRAEEELAMARDEAVEASRLKSALMANVSHEIRTPMNGVIGMNELLLDSQLDAEQREYAEAIRSSGDALMTVIEDILDFSKIEAGKLELHAEVFQLPDVVEEVVTMLASAADDKDVELIACVDPPLPDLLRGDANRIRQVLTNFMTNAVKFTHDGEVVVHVSGRPHGDGRIAVRFEVRDTGIGIEPASMERVFDAFCQVDSSTTRRYGGTGLGLAISKQLVALMDGEIGAQSTPGSGSTFWFTVPLEVVAGRQGAPDLEGLGGVRALVVDDNATNRTILERRLSWWGMSCHSAPGAEQALRLLRVAATQGRPYAIVLLDARMPGTSGVDLAAAIKADASISSARLVMLTSSGAGREAAIAAGVERFVTKPVRESRLREEIARALAPRLPDPPVDASPQERCAPHPAPPWGGRVLVAEDNPINQRVVVRMLEQRGCRVAVADNGRQALDMLDRERFDAVFMDCQMPELDGYATAAEIRRREGAERHTPIIAMTANTIQGDREKCLAAGMDDYLGKPLQAPVLAEILGRVLPSRAEATASDGPIRAGEDPGAGGQPPLLDHCVLDDVYDGAEPQREELVTIFLDQCGQQIVKLAKTLAAGDADTAQRTAHSLEGSSATLGAQRLSAIAGRMCEAVAAGRLADAAAYQAEIERVYELTSAAFQSKRPIELIP